MSNENEKKLLVIANSLEEAQVDFGRQFDPDSAELLKDPLNSLAQSLPDDIRGVFIASSQVGKAFDLNRLAREHVVFNLLPVGIAVIDKNSKILWCNRQLQIWFKDNTETDSSDDNASQNFDESVDQQTENLFYKAFGNPAILGPDFCPFHTVRTTLLPTKTDLKTGKNTYYQMDVAPFHTFGWCEGQLIVVVQEVSDLKISEQRFDSLLKVGGELADLTPDQLQDMTPEDRIELLKVNIIRYTEELLDYNVIEIRLLTEGGKLEPLLASGMDMDAMNRDLYANATGNGVTGYVAAKGISYLCEDATEDQLYLKGVEGAKSSVTVPLIYLDKVIGTFNIESFEPRAFTAKDLRFIEIFARDVTVAIHTLDLLSAEKAGTVAASVEAIHRAVALPIDQILNAAVLVLDQHPDLEPKLKDQLVGIQSRAREIKLMIQQIGAEMTPAQAHPFPPPHPLLNGSKILVVDSDESVLIAANEILSRYGATVESAPAGEQAILMVKNTHYDVIISDIALPDCSWQQLLLKLKAIMNVSPIPLALMKGYGYDPGHVIQNAKNEGVDSFLYKPFILNQLLPNVEKIISRNRPVSPP